MEEQKRIFAQIETALADPRPVDALYELAKALRDQGVPQQQLYDCYLAAMNQCSEDADQTLYDALADVSDLICGWCRPEVQLFPDDLFLGPPVPPALL